MPTILPSPRGVQLRVTHPANGDQRLDRVRVSVGAVVDTDDKVEGTYTFVVGVRVGIAFKIPAVAAVFEHTFVEGETAASAVADLVAQINAAAIPTITAVDLGGGSIQINRSGVNPMGLWFYARYPGVDVFKEYVGVAPFAVTSNAYRATAGTLVKAMSTIPASTASDVSAFFGAQQYPTQIGINGVLQPSEWADLTLGLFEIGSIPGDLIYAFACSVGGGAMAIIKGAVIVNGPNTGKQGVGYFGNTVRRSGLNIQNKNATVIAYAAFGAVATTADFEIAPKTPMNIGNLALIEELHINITAGSPTLFAAAVHIG